MPFYNSPLYIISKKVLEVAVFYKLYGRNIIRFYQSYVATLQFTALSILEFAALNRILQLFDLNLCHTTHLFFTFLVLFHAHKLFLSFQVISWRCGWSVFDVFRAVIRDFIRRRLNINTASNLALGLIYIIFYTAFTGFCVFGTLYLLWQGNVLQQPKVVWLLLCFAYQLLDFWRLYIQISTTVGNVMDLMDNLCTYMERDIVFLSSPIRSSILFIFRFMIDLGWAQDTLRSYLSLCENLANVIAIPFPLRIALQGLMTSLRILLPQIQPIPPIPEPARRRQPVPDVPLAHDRIFDPRIHSPAVDLIFDPEIHPRNARRRSSASSSTEIIINSRSQPLHAATMALYGSPAGQEIVHLIRESLEHVDLKSDDRDLSDVTLPSTITTFQVPSEQKEKLDDCAICCESFKPFELAVKTSCMHTFHELCMEKLFISLKYKCKPCPLCRKDLETGEERDSSLFLASFQTSVTS